MIGIVNAEDWASWMPVSRYKSNVPGRSRWSLPSDDICVGYRGKQLRRFGIDPAAAGPR
jgi:hypothetical protein